jgi:hypothetical protein
VTFFSSVAKLTVGVLLATTTIPAIAKTSNGTSQTRSISAKYADCVVKKSAPQARAAIAELAGNLIVIKKYKRLIDSPCMEQVTVGTSSGGIAFGGDTFFYTMADALIRKDYSQFGPTDFSAVAMLVHRQKIPSLSAAELEELSKRKQAEVEKDVAKVNAFSTLSRFGECAVRGNPEVARQLSLTDTGSTEERIKFNILVPTLSKCLEPGTTVKFSPILLRGTIALNYFRLAYASQTASIPLTEAIK